MIGTMLCEGLCAMQNCGVGGGFVMTFYEHKKKTCVCLDARETAPMSSHKDMFNGNPDLSSTGALSVAVPGELMGYWEAHKRFGKLPWEKLFEPAIKLCKEGIPVNNRLAKIFDQSGIGSEIMGSPTMRELLCPGGIAPCAREKIKLKELAKTLEIVSKSPRGANELYDGSLSKQLVDDLRSLGGIITLQDLSNYQVKWKQSLQYTFKEGDTLYTAPPPTSGCVLTFLLSLLEENLVPDPCHNLINLQRTVEAFKYAYALRSELGDPDFVDFEPIERKIKNKDHILNLRNKITNLSRTSSNMSEYGAIYDSVSDSGTINIVVLAPNGDAVAATSTINTLFGAMVASLSTGIILNNEMDDFSSPHIVNSFQVTPSPANYIMPGKRPLSSSCPSIIVDRNGDVRMVVGAAGGTNITTATAQVIMNHMWLGQNIKEAVDKPRIHHQLLPMILKYEAGVPKELMAGLEKIGHKTKLQSPHSCVTAITQRRGQIHAIYDFRRGGSTSGV